MQPGVHIVHLNLNKIFAGLRSAYIGGGAMRRKDRQMSKDFALKIIDQSQYGVLGLGGEDPYTVPLSLVRRENFLYFHSAIAGKKIEKIKDGDRVSLTFVGRVQVPKNFNRDQVQDFIDQEKFAEVGTKVYTTEFESAHVSGKISRVEDPKEMKEALLLIAKKYTPDLADLSLPFIKASFSRTAVFRIEILEINGKRKKFDSQGVEMKFQREE